LRHHKSELTGSRVNDAFDPAHAPVLAEITGFSVEATGVVETVKPVLLCPAGTVTWVGTLAEPDELDRLTGCPPAGAGVVRATFPLMLFPPITSDLESVTFPTQSAEDGFTVNVADCVLAEEAVMVAVVEDDTVDVETGTVAVVWPAGIVTEAGTVAAALLLARFTKTPPVGAAAANVTVPVAPWPLVTVEGETVKLERVAC
jgi:hypothetical protein